MASVEVDQQASALGDAITHGRNLVRVPSTGRLFSVYNDGTNGLYSYSDDDGATWETPVTTFAGSNLRMQSAFYDAANNRLNIACANGNNTAGALRFRAITTNADQGTPGSLSTEVQIDAGGTNLGVIRPYAFYSDTSSNPRYWIVAAKYTAAAVIESRAWYVDAGTDADTAGNWSTTNFENLGSNSDSEPQKGIVGVHWKIAGNDRVTLVMCEGSSDAALDSVTFDPTAATPTPGSTTTFGSSHQPTLVSDGMVVSVIAKDDYLVATCFEATTGDVNFFKTVDGTTWTQPGADWVDELMGYHQLASNGTDFYVVYANAYGDLSSTDHPLEYRKLTTSSDVWSAGVAFSDTEGNGIAVPENTGTTNLFAFYRAGTVSPYSLRSDLVSIAAPPATTTRTLALMGAG